MPQCSCSPPDKEQLRRRGTPQHYHFAYYCTSCDGMINPPGCWVPKRAVIEMGIDPESVPFHVSKYDLPPELCSVCGTTADHLHHTAPRHIFGGECERWPTVWLCKPCHESWHRKIREHYRSAP